MSFRSERGVRNIIAVATGISLFGVVSALVDYSNSHEIFAGNGVTDVPRLSPPDVASRSYTLSPDSQHLFAPGKHDRADTGHSPINSDGDSNIVTATLTPIDVFDQPSVAASAGADDIVPQTVNRQEKSDPLPANRMGVAQYIPPVDDRETEAVFRTSPPLADARISEKDTSSEQSQKAGPIRTASLTEL
ncbi:MAG: hypothetical protein P8Y67_05725, partial [Alphaproteobacteria bacterium]